MIEIINYITVICLLLSVVFTQIIIIELRKKKILESFWDYRFYIPFYIFYQYIQVTRKEKGHIGIWFWLTIFSVSVTLITAILYEFIRGN